MAISASEPIGDAVFGPLFIRLSLGLYLVVAALAKIKHLEAFVDQVKSFGVLSGSVAMLYGSTLPYLELLAGGLLLIGFWSTFAAMLTSALLFSFIVGLGIFPHKMGPTYHIFNKDIILLCASLSLLYTGAGAFSLDRFRKGGK